MCPTGLPHSLQSFMPFYGGMMTIVAQVCHLGHSPISPSELMANHCLKHTSSKHCSSVCHNAIFVFVYWNVRLYRFNLDICDWDSHLPTLEVHSPLKIKHWLTAFLSKSCLSCLTHTCELIMTLSSTPALAQCHNSQEKIKYVIYFLCKSQGGVWLITSL